MLYEFIYKRSNLNDDFKYHSFIRQSDRLISEQKQDIYKLLANGIDKDLLEFVKPNLDKVSDKYNLVIQFTFEFKSRELAILNLGSFPNIQEEGM